MNAYQQFALLIAGPQLSVGTVSAVYSDGTVLVDLQGGGSVRVLGTGWSVSNPVYVLGGRVEGGAPALPYVEVTV